MSAQKTRLLNYFLSILFILEVFCLYLREKQQKMESVSVGSLKTTPFPIKSKIEVVHSNEEGIFYVKFFWRKMVASTQILKKLRIWTLNRCFSTGLQACLPIYQKDGKGVNSNVVSHEKSKTDISMKSRDIFSSNELRSAQISSNQLFLLQKR